MKTIAIRLAFLLALGSCGEAFANAQLAEQKQCFQCHSMEHDGIGPSFQTIRAIYRTMPHAEAMLVDVIQMGSEAHLGPLWGKARMPDTSERPEISDEEARQLARWILH